jgi:hypothetical protein
VLGYHRSLIDDEGVQWNDATAILSTLMRIDARLDALQAKLRQIERLLDGDDEEEEEGEL